LNVEALTYNKLRLFFFVEVEKNAQACLNSVTGIFIKV
jgi:hypothetical protein